MESAMNLSDINLDLNAAGTWPLGVKAFVIILTCMTAIGAGVYFITLDQLDLLEITEQKESTLKIEFEGKQKKAVNLQDYQEQLTQIEASLDEMIRQMPTEEEVASLLIDISQTGLASGLQFKLFKPEAPVRKDFYSELPINIQVTGKYEELGLFVSGLASLPRIVTLHNVNITPELKNEQLLMSAVVKTYNEGSTDSIPDTDAKRRVRK
jgi:type IV pilus assembly protein PilO